jgi:hypothetical protein
MSATSSVQPPRWAERVLALLLDARRRDDILGDLLEEYREAIHPARGASAADRWYVRQVAGFLWQRTWPWAAFFSGAFLLRTAFDWFAPVNDFHTRSTLSTAIGVSTLFAVAFFAARRARSVFAGPLAAVVTSQLAAVVSMIGVIAFLALRHDAQTWTAIQGSGGWQEAIELPFMMIVPATVLGAAGGVAGKLLRHK